LTHFRIVQSVGPNSLDRSPHLRPAQTNSTICLRNSAGYFVPLFDISDSFSVDTEVSTETGQAHSSPVVMTGCSTRCIVARSPPLNEVHVALEHFDFRWPLPHVVGSPHRRVLSASLTACEPSDRPRFIGLANLTGSAWTHRLLLVRHKSFAYTPWIRTP